MSNEPTDVANNTRRNSLLGRHASSTSNKLRENSNKSETNKVIAGPTRIRPNRSRRRNAPKRRHASSSTPTMAVVKAVDRNMCDGRNRLPSCSVPPSRAVTLLVVRTTQCCSVNTCRGGGQRDLTRSHALSKNRSAHTSLQFSTITTGNPSNIGSRAEDCTTGIAPKNSSSHTRWVSPAQAFSPSTT
jgi:hypothetical protein